MTVRQMKTAVDLVCQREQNSLSRDFLQKLPILEMSPCHVHHIFIVSRSICSLSTLNYSFNFRFAIWCGTSIISSDILVCICLIHYYCIQTFLLMHWNFLEGQKGVSIFKRHCVCLPWCLLTWQYLSMDFIHRFIPVSLSTEIGFYFYPQESCKAACQVKNTKWAKVFKLRIWSWSLISSYMTKRSHNFGWFILKQCMLSHAVPEMSSVGNADLDENSP